jgi:DNA topoisomerase-1
VRRGSETRSLRETDDVFTLTLAAAQELLRQEKRGGRRGPQVLRELGPSPDGGEPLRLLSGRYGPYVTDGTVNASLPQGTDPGSFTAEQAVALLREKAARSPSRKKKARRTTKKKTTRKSTGKAAAGKKTGKKVKAGGLRKSRSRLE